MYNHNSIQLLQVANGWMVVLPEPEFSYPMGLTAIGSTGPSEEELRRQARIFQDEIQGDNLLKELTDEPKPKQPTIKDQKNNNIFVFADHVAALDFLKEKLA